jgi:regulation of enolase protein 1 (concanavalin A-like superfamily)
MLYTIVSLRVGAMLLCSLVVVSVSAAPAPVYKPRPSKVWFDGWDAPIDRVGGCTFTRTGEKLTLTVPGSNPGKPALLLRDVEGDFVLEVRVSGEFIPAMRAGYRKAGVVLEIDGTHSRMNRVTEVGAGIVTGLFRGELTGNGQSMGCAVGILGKDIANISHFRVRRKGNELIWEAKEDGTEWETMNNGFTALALPKKIKIGVSAEATAPGSFKVEFDQFKLTKPAK